MMPFIDAFSFGIQASAILLAMILVIITVSAALHYAMAYNRLDAAQKNQRLEIEIAANEARRDMLTEQIEQLNQKVTQRDRVAAEIAALAEQLEHHRLEYSSLDDQRREIEELKHEAANVAEACAKLETARAETAELERREEALRRELEGLDRLRDERKVGLEEALSELKADIATSRIELEKTRDELGPLRAERDALIAMRGEVAALGSLKAGLARDTAEAKEMISRLRNEIDDAREDLEEVNEELQPLRSERDALLGMRSEAAALEARRDGLIRELADLEEQRLQAKQVEEQLRDARAAFNALRHDHAHLEEDVDRLRAQKAVLEEKEGGAVGGETRDVAELMKDLKVEPDCLKSPSLLSNTVLGEHDALQLVGAHLTAHGLRYHPRTQTAFHTALKINDHAQMTVLAGVSGTGKSLLPRRYAEALGIHFLPIAVEPRWDSPQDLLGFYNYVEKGYRATDLARALAQIDPFDTAGIAREDRQDRMLMVLLDEMNLARVEYYFSEFLSRLENRPHYKDVGSESARSAARLQIDIRGLAEDMKPALFPAHNVLFTGTMNDDESTQSLSDKVIDRSNIMQFPAPQAFEKTSSKVGPTANDEALPFNIWRGWVRSIAEMDSTDRSETDKIIAKLSKIMQKAARPFGHRLNDSIIAYAANYPRNQAHVSIVRDALADQIELRILPKLRGVEISEHQEAFDDLIKLVREDLGDTPLSEAIDQSLKEGSNRGLFSWRGFERS